MHTTLVRIGNSRGIRLSKAVIEAAGLESDLELEVENGTIIIRSAHKARDGWDKAASNCHLNDEDNLEDWNSTLTDFTGEW